MEWNVFQATYDSDTLRAAYRDAHGKTRDLGKLLLPERVREGVINRARILKRVGTLPPQAFIRKARRIYQTELTPANETDPSAGIRAIIAPHQVQTTFHPAQGHYRIDVLVRPLLTDHQIHRYIPRHHHELAIFQGMNTHEILPEELKRLTHRLQWIARDEEHASQPAYRRDIFERWQYQPPTGAYDWNARATGLLPASPRPLPDLALSLIHDTTISTPTILRVEYTPRRK